jgi:cyclin B
MFLAVSIIDRFLSIHVATRPLLQLVGITALLLATKHEEPWSPDIDQIVRITDNAYSRAQVLRMESFILSALNFRLSAPTAFHFLSRNLKVLGTDERSVMGRMALMMLERAVQEHDMWVGRQPSLLGAAAAFAALTHWFGAAGYTKDIENAFGNHKLTDVHMVACDFARSMQGWEGNGYAQDAPCVFSTSAYLSINGIVPSGQSHPSLMVQDHRLNRYALTAVMKKYMQFKHGSVSLFANRIHVPYLSSFPK